MIIECFFFFHNTPGLDMVFFGGGLILQTGFLLLAQYIDVKYLSLLHIVQFEGAEWDRSSPTERLRSSRPLPTTGSMKLRKPSDPHSMIGERVDPTLPLEKQVYIQPITTNHYFQMLSKCQWLEHFMGLI